MSKLPKLVRNKIPEIISESGKACKTRIAKSEEMKEFLFEKLKEESREFFEKPSVEEAADMYEVFLAILNHWKIDFTSVVNHAYYKREERGSFNKKIILEVLGS